MRPKWKTSKIKKGKKMFKVEKQYKVIIKRKSGDYVFVKRAFNLTSVKQYITRNVVYDACHIDIFGILNPHIEKEKWVLELLATRELTEYDIEWGITSETAKWVNWGV